MEDTVRVADRIFSIIELLAYAQKPMPLSLISETLNLSKSTAFRLLQTMLARNYVRKNPDNTYTIGPKLIETASYYINSLELQTEATPFLSVLYSTLNLSVHMGVLENFKLVYVSKLDRYPTARSFARIGYETPAYCSSIGKCLLAGLSGKDLEEFLSQCDFTAFTSRTITDPAKLKEQLRKVRVQGWAIDNEESQPGHRCVAAPVFDYRSTIIAGVGVSGNTLELSDDQLPTIISTVMNTAMQISRRMGYTD